MSETPEIIEKGPGFRRIRPGRRFDAAKYLGKRRLRSTIVFATPEGHEDLHWEQGREFLIPQDGPLTVRVCEDRCKCDDKGDDPELGGWREVTVEVGEVLVVSPGHCHRVTSKSRRIALKPAGRFKVCAKPKSVSKREARGACKQKRCSLRKVCRGIYLEGRAVPQ